ncbi:DUF4286 family protein [Vulgatibacter sp.]|uniref:DUF4286 family protein n=1 Tax=Vulgatibacter sp. TaxID=1971226 RepID=UPI003568CFE7
MVLYLVESDVPAAKAEEFSSWLATHVTKVVAAMGRSAFASRARVVGGDEGRFVAVYELTGIPALENYMMSRERAELAEETTKAFPEAKLQRSFAERVAQPRRGMRHGEEPGAAFVVRVALPAAEADGWSAWYEGEHMPEVLGDPGFVRARLFEVHSEVEGERHFVAIYDAVDLGAVGNFRDGRGPKLGEAHATRYPNARIDRQIWEWQQ